jgi:hypothetical protein
VVEAGLDYERVLDFPTSVRNRLIERTRGRIDREIDIEVQKLKSMRKMWTGK